jgi:hypothetical protein
MPPHRGGFDPFLGPANNGPAPSFFSTTFGPYAAIIGTVLLFVGAFVGIYLYFKTYGYTVQMGWDRLKGVFGNKEQVDISTTADGDVTGALSLVPPPPNGSSAHDGSGSGSGDHSSGSLDGRGPFNPDERPSGMPGAIEGPGLFDKALDSMEKAFGPGKQIFNINRNIYTYDDAAPLCKAMGAELATFDQVKKAQKHGADWCNYGWVKGQMAVYPTSEATWNKLQTGPHEYRNSCGKPGVNGGRFDNPEIRFGVNCFGARPQKKDTDELIFNTETGLPPTAEEIEFDKKVQKFRDEMENITVLPWSRGSWSA